MLLRKEMENYEKLEKIGEGTYGKVYKGRDKTSGDYVALKKIIYDAEEGVPATAIREVSLLRNLSQCLYIVKLLDVKGFHNVNEKYVLYLIFEFADSDLQKHIESMKKENLQFSAKDIQSYMYQLISGLAYCHSHGVFHRDLKPANILVHEKLGMLKIGDLGLGRAFSVPLKGYSEEVATLWYRAPELLLGATRYSTAIDVWSLGCIFAELCTLKPLFAGDSQVQQLINIFRVLGTPNEQVWPGVTKLRDWHEFPQWKPQEFSEIFSTVNEDALDLLSKMLQYDPAERISGREALNHPYFDTLDKSQY